VGTSSGLSVCIPTHSGRGILTSELLDTVVAASTTVGEPVEIIVVDDSTGPEAEKVARKCDEVGAWYTQGPRSAARKRNLAAGEARHDLLFFVDSDCLVTEKTLAAHLKALRESPDDVAGIVGLTEMQGEVTKVWQTIKGTQFHNPCFDFAQRFEQVGWGTTANVSVRRDVFSTAGGFAEDAFTLVGGEDVDFGLRVTKLGYRWITSSEALVQHRRSPITKLGHVFCRLFTYGRADVFLMEQYPERCDGHANPYALSAAALLAGVLAGRRGRRLGLASAVILPTLLLVAEAQRRRTSKQTLYGDRPDTDAGTGQRSLFYHLKASAIDSTFDAGLAWEALRRGKPLRAFTRFAYVDNETFVPRKRR
jgi:glycosyltransferase involved in cell wall biosynthesis